jgi:hypothetical protein
MNKALGRNIPINAMNFWYRLEKPVFPMADGSKLYEDDPDAEVSDKIEFGFKIAFYEADAGIVDPKPLLETLRQLATLIDGIVTALSPRLNATP